MTISATALFTAFLFAAKAAAAGTVCNHDSKRCYASSPDPAPETTDMDAIDEICRSFYGPDAICSEPTDPTRDDEEDPSSGCYDGIGRLLSDEECERQSAYELEHGLPYYRDREDEQRRLHVPLSVMVHSNHYCREDDSTMFITLREYCYVLPGGKTVFVESLPSNCNVESYQDRDCTEDPFLWISGISHAPGCHETDEFESVAVRCGSLPD